MKNKKRVFDASDPGTGKTFVQIMDFTERRRKGGGCALVFGTKSILDVAWAADFEKFAPDMRISVAYAENREEAFKHDVDVYITNIDAAVWVAKQKPAFFKRFDTLIVDECFPAGELVDTPNGPTPIEVLECGDLVYTTDGPLPISKIFTKESYEIYEIKFENGIKIRCTGNHPFATTHGWMEARTTRGVHSVRLNLYKLHKQRSGLLWKKLFSKSNVGKLFTGTDNQNSSKELTSEKRDSILEQRDSLPRRNQAEIEPRSQSFRSSTDQAWWKWFFSPVRANDAGNASSILEITVPSQNRKETWLRLSARIQSGLRFTFEKLGFGSGWDFTHIAKELGCKKRFLTEPTRVVSISRIKCPSPILVYNLQVDGPHNYSVRGQLVHNCTTVKHHTTQRSKALGKIAKHFDYRRLLSGTPNTNGVCDLWHQYLILDDGVRLGKSYYAFRSATGTAEQVGPNKHALKWTDKPGIENVVGALIKDITIRHKFEDCVDIPANFLRHVDFTLSKKHQASYEELEAFSVAKMGERTVSAVNAAVLYSKLLQSASGAVYDGSGEYALLDKSRYQLIMDLVEERRHSVVFFLWQHQKDQLMAEAEKRGLSWSLIDGTVTKKGERERIVNAYQAGEYDVLFAHPQSTAHGITLTKGTATIWASPTNNLEWWKQGLKRIHRIGQTQKTETIMVIAKNTIDERVWDALQGKNVNLMNLLYELE